VKTLLLKDILALKIEAFFIIKKLSKITIFYNFSGKGLAFIEPKARP
jgi:hypothetical protein